MNIENSFFIVNNLKIYYLSYKQYILRVRDKEDVRAIHSHCLDILLWTQRSQADRRTCHRSSFRTAFGNVYIAFQTAIFEHNGKLSILLKAANRPATPDDLKITAKATHIGVEVIMDGRVMGENLSRMGRDVNWLTKQLNIQGCKDAKEIFLGIYRPEEDKLTLYKNEG